MVDFETAELMIPNGWSELLREAWGRKPGGVTIDGAMEKNGALLIYADGDDDYLQYLLDLRKRSRSVCMACGGKGTWRFYRARAWVLCYGCYAKMLLEDQKRFGA